MWMQAGAMIGVNALQSFIGSRSANKMADAQYAIQQAQAYQQQSREYANLTERLRQQSDYNESVIKTEGYNFSNLLSNVGAMELRDAQLRGVMLRNKQQLGIEGAVGKAAASVEASAVGAMGRSVKAVQQDLDKKISSGLFQVEEQRANQIYDNQRQQEVMWRSFKQNQQEVDDSEIDPIFLPQDPIMLQGGGGRGGFLPHLIGAGLSFAGDQLFKNFELGLKDANGIQFKDRNNPAKPSPYTPAKSVSSVGGTFSNSGIKFSDRGSTVSTFAYR